MAPDPVAAAIYTRLSGDAELEALLAESGAVYHEQAPAGSKVPYVVFQLLSGVEQWAFGPSNERVIWLVKGICRGMDSTPAEEIDARCKALLHRQRLPVSESHSITVLRESRVSYSEPGDGEPVRHRGAKYLIHT